MKLAHVHDVKEKMCQKLIFVCPYCRPPLEGRRFDLILGQTLMQGATVWAPLWPALAPALFHPRAFHWSGEPGRCFLGLLSDFSRAASPLLSLFQPLLGPSPVITTHPSATSSREEKRRLHPGRAHFSPAHFHQIHSETSLVRLLRAKAHYRNLEAKPIYSNWQHQRTDVDLPVRNSPKFSL